MDTAVRTPLAVFTLPQHLVVPLFQRPYVWEEENQWGPLWQDIRRLAELQLANSVSRSGEIQMSVTSLPRLRLWSQRRGVGLAVMAGWD